MTDDLLGYAELVLPRNFFVNCKTGAPKVRVNPNTGCWEWLGALKGQPPNDYASYCENVTTGDYKTCMAHRFAYTMLMGEPPKGMDLDHRCRMPRCVNPLHLDAVPHAVNMDRGISGDRARQTHCLRGHPLSGTNLGRVKNRQRSNGGRFCKRCAQDAKRRWYEHQCELLGMHPSTLRSRMKTSAIS